MQDTQLQQPSSQPQAPPSHHVLSSIGPSPHERLSPPPAYAQSPSLLQTGQPREEGLFVAEAPSTSPGLIQHQAVTNPPLSPTPPISGYIRPQSVASYDTADLAFRPVLSGNDINASRQSLSSNFIYNNNSANQDQGIKQPDVQSSSQHWTHEIHVNSSCRLCTHCRLGIPYHELYYRCSFCQVNICKDCHGSHPQAHYQNLVKITSRQSTPGSKRSEKGCTRCQKFVHSRYDCQECNFTLCVECHLASSDRHEHRSFTSFEPPFRSLKISGDASSQHRCTHSTISNCSRCLGPIGLKHREFKCKTCLSWYDGSINLCEACYVESWTSHDQSHEAISISFESASNDLETGFRCCECSEKAPSLDTTMLTSHAHRSYLFNIGPRARESIVNQAFRACQVKPFRTDQPQVLTCARCKHDFPAVTMRICAGACEGTFCESCFPLASANHMHGPQNFRSLVDKPHPEIGFLPAGWRGMENKEGRIYYIQDLTNAFTFYKPTIPDALPAGWLKTVDPLGKIMYLHHETNTSSYVSPVYGVAPAGWELKQTETGRLFYVNRQTQATSWHKPHSEPLPPGWEAGQHSDGRVYYINHYTKTNTWVKPTLPANATIASPISQAMTPPNSPIVQGPATTMVRPGVPQRSASVMVNRSGFVTGPVVSGVRPQVLPVNSTVLPLRSVSSVSNPTIQHVGPMQAQPGSATAVPRPFLPQQSTSSPTVSTQANTTSSLGSLANGVAHNPQAMNAAVHLGMFAIKAAAGDYSQVHHTNAAPNHLTPSRLTSTSSNSHPGVAYQPYVDANSAGNNNPGLDGSQTLIQNEYVVTSSGSSPSPMPIGNNGSYTSFGDAATSNTIMDGNTVTTSYNSYQPWIPDPSASMTGGGTQDTVTYLTYSSQNAGIPASLNTSPMPSAISGDLNAGQTQVYGGGYDVVSDTSVNVNVSVPAQDYNTYQVQTQESDLSLTGDSSTTYQNLSSYGNVSTGAVNESFTMTSDVSTGAVDESFTMTTDVSVDTDSSFGYDFASSDSGLF